MTEAECRFYRVQGSLAIGLRLHALDLCASSDANFPAFATSFFIRGLSG
jgi:hypothetical protein